MNKLLAMIVPVLVATLVCSVAAADSDRTITIDKETAALLALGFGGYDNDGLFGPLHRQRWGHDYWGGYRDGWRRSQRYYPYPRYRYRRPSWYQRSYRPPARTGFRIRIGDGYLEWWETDYDSGFGFGTDGFQYRNYDRDWSRNRGW